MTDAIRKHLDDLGAPPYSPRGEYVAPAPVEFTDVATHMAKEA
jgi:hypothetical protein